MYYIIFFSKEGDEYLLHFTPSFGFDGYEFSIPAVEKTAEDLEDYFRAQIQDEIDGSGLDDDTAEILQEYLDNSCFLRL